MHVPDHAVVPYVQGDGIGVDIWGPSQRAFDAAVEKAYQGKRRIAWFEVLAGERAFQATGEWLPAETLDAMREYVVSIKGPLTTPVGGGIRSLNVTIRQELDLYSCVRPVRWFRGVHAPVRQPQDVDMVIFRENTEDVYAGIEWKRGSAEAEKLIAFLRDQFGVEVRPDSGIGIKPISEFGSKRLVRKAIQYAIDHGRRSVTLVHKGNIQKFTEGAFRDWGYEVAKEFGERLITEQDVSQQYGGKAPEGRIVIKDRIADNMFQQALLRPQEYDVLATPNLNGDYLSDALAAQIGGIGMAPGANIADFTAVFEATHGTAPKYAGQDKVNPSSLILSGVMMLEHMGWQEAADLVVGGLQQAIADGYVTYDLAGQDSTVVGSSGFATAIIERMKA